MLNLLGLCSINQLEFSRIILVFLINKIKHFLIPVSCRVDNDCFLGHICLNNKCVFGCHSDEDCSSSESCRDNKCVNPCADNPCGINSMCSASNHRASCNCLTGLVPNPTAQIGCVRSSPLSCSKNSECPDQLMCINSQCMTLCASDDACLNKEKVCGWRL